MTPSLPTVTDRLRPIGRSLDQILAQSVEDLEKLDEAVDTETLTGWEIAAAVIILVASWPVAVLVGRIVRRISRRIPHTPEYVPELADRSTRWLVVLIGIAWAASLLGIDVGWFTVIVAFIAIVFVLMVRPLIENLAAGLLLRSRTSFGIGDEVDTNGYRGTVVEINARTTVIQTRDLRRIHIPNQDVLANPLYVLPPSSGAAPRSISVSATRLIPTTPVRYCKMPWPRLTGPRKTQRLLSLPEDSVIGPRSSRCGGGTNPTSDHRTTPSIGPCAPSNGHSMKPASTCHHPKSRSHQEA